MPPDRARIRLGENSELLVDTSKFAGAVTVMSASRFVPLTVKDSEAVAVPELAVNAGRLVVDGVMVGAITVPETAMLWVGVSAPERVRLPE